MSVNTRAPDDRGLDPAGLTADLFRAARRAHEIARDTGTKVIVVVNGKTVEMDPDPEMFDRMDHIGADSRTARLPR